MCLVLGNGPFKKWLDEALKLDIDQRSDFLAQFKELAEAHEECAEGGDTSVSLDGPVEHHFLCYVNIDGKLYEIG